jgi:uncharacterized phiE125 gp8 family phage protein
VATNVDFYELTSAGTSPVLLADMKTYLKVTSSSDDALIQILIDAATEYGQKYTGREFTANTWKLKRDCFTNPIVVARNTVDTITSVQHLVSDILTTVTATDYYLKDGTIESEILLSDGISWPTNTDNREQAIEIIFVTKATPCINIAIEAIYTHVMYLYQNRGDCPDDTMSNSGALSGANALYNIIRIPRV